MGLFLLSGTALQLVSPLILRYFIDTARAGGSPRVLTIAGTLFNGIFPSDGRRRLVMAVGKVLARGQVTLPRDVRRAARIQPGDTVLFRVTGPGMVEMKVLPRLGLAEALDRYRIEGPIDLAAGRTAWHAAAAEDVLEAPDE